MLIEEEFNSLQNAADHHEADEGGVDESDSSSISASAADMHEEDYMGLELGGLDGTTGHQDKRENPYTHKIWSACGC
jgi:hypothetical protein